MKWHTGSVSSVLSAAWDVRALATDVKTEKSIWKKNHLHAGQMKTKHCSIDWNGVYKKKQETAYLHRSIKPHYNCHYGDSVCKLCKMLTTKRSLKPFPSTGPLSQRSSMDREGLGSSMDREGLGSSMDREGLGSSMDREGLGSTVHKEGLGSSVDREGLGSTEDGEIAGNVQWPSSRIFFHFLEKIFNETRSFGPSQCQPSHRSPSKTHWHRHAWAPREN